jgi:hypothetical protein
MDQENAPPVPVVNASLLLSAFGYWPSFHDGEVHRALLDRGGSGEPPSVTLVIHAFDTDNTVDEKGYREADPITLLEGGAPSDEYAPEIGTIIPLLANAHRPDDVTGVLHGEFVRWFGEGTAGPRQAYEALSRQIWDVLLEYRKSG